MTLSLCPHRLAASENVRVASRMVEDNASYAWRNADDEWRCYTQLNSDFVHDFRAQLDEAATRPNENGDSLFSLVLTEVWAKRGYKVEWIDDGDAMQHRPHSPSDQVYGDVWDEAAYRLDPYAVVRAARLDDELPKYAD